MSSSVSVSLSMAVAYYLLPFEAVVEPLSVVVQSVASFLRLPPIVNGTCFFFYIANNANWVRHHHPFEAIMIDLALASTIVVYVVVMHRASFSCTVNTSTHKERRNDPKTKPFSNVCLSSI